MLQLQQATKPNTQL